MRGSVGQVSELSHPRNEKDGIGPGLLLGWGVNFPAFCPTPTSPPRELHGGESQALATGSQLGMWEWWVPSRLVWDRNSSCD